MKGGLSELENTDVVGFIIVLIGVVLRAKLKYTFFSFVLFSAINTVRSKSKKQRLRFASLN